VPDALIIQDPTLLHQVDVFSGLAAGGYILINTARSFDDLGLAEFAQAFRRAHLCTVRATEIALRHVGRPLPNAALLGGFAAMSGRISLDSVMAAIGETVSAQGRGRQRGRSDRGLRVRPARDEDGGRQC
jgi:pyruvate ferredoxin oxidoreductase gamma subunit